MKTLREAMAGPAPVRAPLVLNPLMAVMAEAAGFEALYLGGGATGYAKTVLEANLSLTEMVQAGADIRAVTALPLILDAAAGWGDPMHIHRTVGMAEGAGFAAIEIEDQILPKRAHHHVGSEKEGNRSPTFRASSLRGNWESALKCTYQIAAPSRSSDMTTRAPFSIEGSR